MRTAWPFPNQPRSTRTHVIRGRRYAIRRRPLRASWAIADPDGVYGDGQPKLIVDSRLRGVELLEFLIHELLHVSFYGLAEEAISETANDLAALIWKHLEEIAEEATDRAG